MKQLYLYLVIWTVLSSCQKRDANENVVLKDTTIVLFDIKNYDRNELSKFIKEINDLNPKVIGLDFFLDSLKDSSVDSLLAINIRDSKKVILAARINYNTNLIEGSHPFFTQYAKSEGLNSYLVDEYNQITDYIPLYQDSKRQMTSFPNDLAFAFKVTPNNRITNFTINEPRKIKIFKGTESFVLLDESNIRLNVVQNKIILFSSLDSKEGFTDEYTVELNGKKVKLPLSVITANIILDILNDSK